jgi:hypothetical protein
MMLLIFEVLKDGEPLKPALLSCLNYEGTTRAAMFDAWLNYWERWERRYLAYHGLQQHPYSWRLVEG